MSIPTIAGRRFQVGKYQIIAAPIAHSAHMLRYNVYVNGKRIGALLSVPTESDCRFLEVPPPVPELVPWKPLYRPGRPKKGTPPRTNDAAHIPAEELPAGLSFPVRAEER